METVPTKIRFRMPGRLHQLGYLENPAHVFKIPECQRVVRDMSHTKRWYGAQESTARLPGYLSWFFILTKGRRIDKRAIGDIC